MRDSEAHWWRYACPWKWCSEECKNLYNGSIASHVWIMMVMNWRQNFGLVKLGCLNWLIQDALVKTCQLPVVQGDTEGSFIPFHKHFHQCHGWPTVGNYSRQCQNTRMELCTINMTRTFTIWLVTCCVWTAASKTTKNWMLCLEHELSCEQYTSTL